MTLGGGRGGAYSLALLARDTLRHCTVNVEFAVSGALAYGPTSHENVTL